MQRRYPVANEYGWVDPNAVPNCCIPCTSDSGNWGCWKYRDHITSLIKLLKEEIEEKKKEGISVVMRPIYIPEEYKERILSLTG
jgi:hypothetical protein